MSRTRKIIVWCAVGAVIAGALLLAFFRRGEVQSATGQVVRPSKRVVSAASSRTPEVVRPAEATGLSERAKTVKRIEEREREKEKERRTRQLAREKKVLEDAVWKERMEALPEELRYRHRPKMPRAHEEAHEIRRELRALDRVEKRHPERAEALKRRRAELQNRLATLKAEHDKKISEVRKGRSPDANDMKTIKEK